MNTSGQLDLLDLLRDHYAAADSNLTAIDDQLNVQIDANPDDKLLMEMLDVVSDARESLAEFADLLDTAQRRDERELPDAAPPGTPVASVQTIEVERRSNT